MEDFFSMVKKRENNISGPRVLDGPVDFLSRRLMRFNSFSSLEQLDRPDFVVASDMELLQHYLFGCAGPFVDFLVYVDVGVGWSLKPVDFKNEDAGLEARDLVEKELVKRDFRNTMVQFATYYLVLGRACLIKTYNGLNELYFDEDSHVTGLDCINPMSLDVKSIQDVMNDTTGEKPFIQNWKGEPVSFTRDRVIYRTNNNLSRLGVWGVSPLQRCISDLRLALKFPGFRDRLARKYANIFRVIRVDTDKFVQAVGSRANEILRDTNEHTVYLNSVADTYNEQEDKGSSVVSFDWETISDMSFAGKEVNMNAIELETLKNIALCLDLPLDLLRYDQVVNRSVMEVLTDVFVSKQKSGARNHVYTPIIEGVANEILKQYDITVGRLTVEYSPFLSKNKVEEASVIRDIWSTGALSKPEVREALGLPVKMNLGGDDWKDLEPLPIASIDKSEKTLKGSDKVLTTGLDSVKSFLLEEGLLQKKRRE